LGRGEDIGRKGSENNIWLEAFSKKKNESCAKFLVQQKKSCLLAKKVCYSNDRKQEKKRCDPRDFKNLKKNASLQSLR